MDDIPLKARPQEGRVHRGVHSYTVEALVQDANGEPFTTLIDVLLRQKAFFVKKCSPTGKRGQLSWKKHGGTTHAWIAALEQAATGGVQEDD